MSVATAYSTSSDPAIAAAEVASGIGAMEPKLVVYFASPSIDPEALATALTEVFPRSEVMGCTTAGEIASGRMLKGSVVAMALDAGHVADVDVAVVRNLKAGPKVGAVMAAFSDHFDLPVADMDIGEYVGLVLVDGMSGAEEALMSKVGDATNVEFVGGSAGDDLAFCKTWVASAGVAYEDAAVIALLKPAVPFEVVKTQSFRGLGKTLVATSCDVGARTVMEFDGKPAAVAYAEALGVEPAEVEHKFQSNPVGLMMEGEPYVRSPQRASDGSMVFYCNVLEGMKLELLESTDIVADTRDALAGARADLGGLSALINFNCILRTLELEEKGLMQQYADVFADVPTVGFSTYGEEYMGHINQTATMLAFG
jgi:hypothetical protein